MQLFKSKERFLFMMMAITIHLEMEVSLVGPLQLFLVTVGKDKLSIRIFYNPGSDFFISHLLLIQSMSIISEQST